MTLLNAAMGYQVGLVAVGTIVLACIVWFWNRCGVARGINVPGSNLKDIIDENVQLRARVDKLEAAIVKNCELCECDKCDTCPTKPILDSIAVEDVLGMPQCPMEIYHG